MFQGTKGKDYKLAKRKAGITTIEKSAVRRSGRNHGRQHKSVERITRWRSGEEMEGLGKPRQNLLATKALQRLEAFDVLAAGLSCDSKRLLQCCSR